MFHTEGRTADRESWHARFKYQEEKLDKMIREIPELDESQKTKNKEDYILTIQHVTEMIQRNRRMRYMRYDSRRIESKLKRAKDLYLGRSEQEDHPKDGDIIRI